MAKIYIFTGKGGVGKSSVATAHAIKSAKEGVRTILISTDMAHNLGDILEFEASKEPVKIMENLDVYEIDPNYVMENDFTDLLKSIDKLIPQTDGHSMKEFGIIPGMEELFSLLKISQIYNEGFYERIIVDCAPTGETLSLLKMPELLSWYMEKFLPVGKVAIRLLNPVSKHLFKVELPNREGINDIEKLYIKLNELQNLLKDRDTTSIRLVTIPEKMVVEETKRNYMYMNLYDFNVDALYINRILPNEIENHFFTSWKEIQSKYIKELKESFMALKIYNIPWYGEELRGRNAIAKICQDSLEGSEVFDLKKVDEREKFEKIGDEYKLSIKTPHAEKDSIELFQSNTDLVIKIENFKRNIPLPNILRKYEVVRAKFEDNKLNVYFKKGEGEDE